MPMSATQLEELPKGLFVGDPAPWFFAATASNPRYAFSSVAGRYVLLVFAGPLRNAAVRQAYQTLREAQAAGRLNDTHCAAFVLSIDPADDGEDGPRDKFPGLRVLRDRNGAVSKRYGVLEQPESGPMRYTPTVMLLDPLLRVMETGGLEQLPRLLAVIDGLPEPTKHAGLETPAPVLVLPRVLEPELCRAFIAVYEAGGGQVSGFMVSQDGKTLAVHDRSHKIRRDQEIEDETLRAALRARISRRLAPEMIKAFQFEPTRVERYIVACYDGQERGHFRAHRDNTTPGTAHRRFAVTINLNDDFDGGELWFPEFGSRRYRPPPGGAVVFSCSLLHEATPVTRGLRYATLPFLYDEAAAKIRRANAATIVPEATKADAGSQSDIPAPTPGPSEVAQPEAVRA